MALSPITTDKLLKKLTDIGLTVSQNMLAQDVKKGYLPSPEKSGRGPRQGVGGLWNELAVRRAVYLYRLRSRKVTGDLLRVILFLKDGWGWSEVKQICLAGLQKMILVQSSPVRKHLRKPTPSNVEFCFDEIAEETDTNPKTEAFILGMGLFGKPIAGGSLQHLFSTFQPFFIPDGNSKGKDFFKTLTTLTEQFIVELGFTWEDLVKLVKTADDAVANKARLHLHQQRREFRQMLRKHNTLNGIHNGSTNFLTFCGQSEKSLKAVFRTIPQRITVAQLLGSCLVPAIALERIDSQMLKSVQKDLPDFAETFEKLIKGEQLDEDKLLHGLSHAMNFLNENAESDEQQQWVNLLRPFVSDLELKLTQSK